MSFEEEARHARLARAQSMLAVQHDDEIVRMTGCSYKEVLALRAGRASEPQAAGEARRNLR